MNNITLLFVAVPWSQIMCPCRADYSNLLCLCVMLLLLDWFFVELEFFLEIMMKILWFEPAFLGSHPDPCTLIAHGFSSFWMSNWRGFQKPLLVMKFVQMNELWYHRSNLIAIFTEVLVVFVLQRLVLWIRCLYSFTTYAMHLLLLPTNFQWRIMCRRKAILPWTWYFVHGSTIRGYFIHRAIFLLFQNLSCLKVLHWGFLRSKMYFNLLLCNHHVSVKEPNAKQVYPFVLIHNKPWWYTLKQEKEQKKHFKTRYFLTTTKKVIRISKRSRAADSSTECPVHGR